MNKPYFLILIIAFSYILACRSSPEVISATYQFKDTNLEGIQQRHAILTVKTNKPLYYLNDPVCGCSKNMTQCHAKRAPSGIDETGYNITVIEKDVWYNFNNVSFDDILYFKFNLQLSTNDPCPILKLEHNLNIGDANMAISNRFIPNRTDSQFIKDSWFRDAFWICPSNYEWGYGTWYIAIFSNTPRVNYLSYRLRWSTKDVNTCVPPPPKIASPVITDYWKLLENDIAYEGFFESQIWYRFRYYINATTADFSISARPLTPYYKTNLTDFDLYVSLHDPHPEIMKASRNNYSSVTEHDDFLTLKNIKAINNNSFIVVYIGLWNWQGNGIMGSIVSNSRSTNWAKSPLIDNGPGQTGYSSANDFARLICAKNNEDRDLGYTENFRSGYPSYAGAMPGDQWGAQMPWYPYAATTDTLRVNHMWPIPKANTDFYFLNNLDWSELPDHTVNMENTLMSAVTIFTRTATDIKYHVLSDISTCYLQWNGVIVDIDGEPITGQTYFTPEKGICNKERVGIILKSMHNIISEMVTMTEYNDLRMARTQLNFLEYSNDWIYCRDEMYDAIFNTQEQVITVNSSASRCDKYIDTDEWRADPCCNTRAQLHSCCAAGAVSTSYIVLENIKSDNVDKQCSISQCAMQKFNTLLHDSQIAEDPDIGCTAAFNVNAGPVFLAESTDFYKLSRQMILGDDLKGRKCNSNNDCFIESAPYLSNATCDTENFVCSYSDSDVLTQWAKTIDPLIARALFDLWKIPEIVTEQRLMAEFRARFMKNTCVGPTGIKYRENYNFASQYPECTDACYDPSNGIDIQPYCFEQEEQYCPIPLVCSTWLPPANWCWRQFFHRSEKSQTACLAEKKCNWLNCDSYNPSCENQCNATSNEYVCIECTSSGCISRLDLLMTQCVNTTTSGTCSLSCAGNTTCSDKTSCETAGICTGKESSFGNTIFDYYNVSGLCFSPFIADYFGNAYCGGKSNFDWSDGQVVEPISHYGCVCSNYPESHPNCNLNTNKSQCENMGFLWVNNDITKFECENSPRRCFNPDKAPNIIPAGAFSTKTEENCGCAGEIYRPVNQWISGTWSSSKSINRFWRKKAFESVNSWNSSIDYIGFGKEVARASIARVALAYYTEALCRYGSHLDALDVYMCDCAGGSSNNNNNDQCYQRDDNYLFAVERVCPEISQEYKHSQADVTIAKKSFPLELYCQNMYLSLLPATSFNNQIKNKLSSEIFISHSINPYAVVHTLQSEKIIGQILTHGINISWSSGERLGEAAILCIPIYNNVPFSQLGIGELIEGKTGIVYREGYVYSNNSNICFNITQPGIYFGIALIVTKDINNKPSFIASTIIYLILTVAITVQIFRYLNSRDYKKPSVRTLKPILLVFCALFASLRFISMFYHSIGGSDDIILKDAMNAIFEIASALFPPMTAGLYVIWRTITLGIKKMRPMDKSKPLPRIFVIPTIIHFGISILHIIVFYTISEPSTLPCLSSISLLYQSNHVTTNISYQIYRAVVAIFVAVVYLHQATVFIKISKRHPRVVQVTALVLVVFVPMFLTSSILIVWSTVTNSEIPVVIFTLLEVIPVMELLYYILPFKVKIGDSPSGVSTPSSKRKNGASTSTQSTLEIPVINAIEVEVGDDVINAGDAMEITSIDNQESSGDNPA